MIWTIPTILTSNLQLTDPDAQNYITRWETAAGASMDKLIKNAFTVFIIELKNNGFWTKFASGDIAPMYGGTSATHAICIKGNSTLVFPNSATFNSTGTDWNASTQY